MNKTNQIENAIDELKQLSKYVEILESPDEYFQHMQGHTTELSLVLCTFTINNMSDYIIEALSKQIPQKVQTEYSDNSEQECFCICGTEVKVEHQEYCSQCGQKLKW